MPSHRTLLALLALVLAAALPGAAALAAEAAPTLLDEEALRTFITGQVAQTGTQLTRVEVRLGRLDPQAVPPACGRVEPFVPPGGRLWGRSSLGLRCVSGATWSALLPVTVSAWGQALVAAGPLAAGAVLAPQDLAQQEVELSREAPGALREPRQAEGMTLARSLSPGQVLHTNMVRMTTVVQAGDPVRLRIQGQGFSISSSGQAMGAAGNGQPVRVRTDLGKVLTGVAREGRVVDVTL